MDINKDILRWVLLIAATPIWLPFLRMLWKDFNRALEEEGGIFGRPPRSDEIERIRREKLMEPETLVSESWARRGERRTLRSEPGPSSARNTSAGGAQRSRGTSSRAPRGNSPGFRANPERGEERGGGFR